MTDFRSNLIAPDLRRFFPHAKPLARSPYGHEVLHDPDLHAVCGYMTADEAAILYHVAKLRPSVWLEIGSFVGWSAAHLAMAGVAVLAVDQEYTDRNAIKLRAEENLKAAHLLANVELIGNSSDGFFQDAPIDYFDGVFIDGNHDAPEPLRDAQRALTALNARGVIVLHDYAGRPIRDAVDWLFDQGFKVRIYQTPAQLAVCWRGDFTPPGHTPDPACVR